MYKELNEEDQIKIIGEESLSNIAFIINDTVKDEINTPDAIGKIVFGSMALPDITLTDGTIADVFIKYVIKILDKEMFDVEIHECIIFDEMCDKILDKYNEVKKLTEEYENRIKTIST